MIGNLLLKNFLQTYVFGGFSFFNKRVRHDRKKIMLYSNMGFRDNVKSLYDHLVKNRYNEKYEIICACNDFDSFSNVCIPNVKFVNFLLVMYSIVLEKFLLPPERVKQQFNYGMEVLIRRLMKVC